ncbi:alkylhydroperoxidase [Staphylococcus kloosii]|jgi:alkylhydroperoxidase family enzyme|uniref:Alkylhydroperoxidase n=1 Tax=Staphylococcus kloosii TaxID=29384 RepID=A0ABQ0XHD5_9STAP|nr:alkylhydroperoxidase [Staphylococcus kloosii]AVQ36390.1 alkylhydroperoxidase [Staphylococcus kloosii]MBF7022290.1 carboxymuconolactone decarboxylase family protein [Staphylococcus kloosii]PNZ07258.1 alkylhydroperoxidase [Staphylococcus kloosii]PTJ73758.1 alkylhydroperoxidase [Staphylococcus kloosii]SUM49476.1 Uncharacterised protein [Staphylococcus kloosii]
MTIINYSKNGETPFQKLLGYNNEIMSQWTKLSEVLEKDGYLSQDLKEEMRRMLAQENGCKYCKAKGKPRRHLIDDKAMICIGFIEVYLKVGINIPNYIIEELKSNLTEEEISELLAFITFTTCQQYFGALMELEG